MENTVSLPVARRTFDEGFWVPGVLAGALGTLLGLLLQIGVNYLYQLSGSALRSRLLDFLLAFVVSLAVGTAQWQIVRERLTALRWWEWVLLAAGGHGLLGFLFSTNPATNLAALMTTAGTGASDGLTLEMARSVGLLLLAAGLVTGAAQALALARYMRGAAAWWLLTNALALPVGIIAAGATLVLGTLTLGTALNLIGQADLLREASAQDAILLASSLITGAVPAVLTGLVLPNLVRSSQYGGAL